MILPLLLFWAFMAGAEAAERPRVLVTAFEPFLGRGENGSERVADQLKNNPLFQEGIDYQICLLPVEYDRAAIVAKQCYESMDPKPAMVISTGEAVCNIRVETQAHNLDNSSYVADNAGVIRVNSPIEQGAPIEESLHLPSAAMVCAGFSSEGPAVVPSVSPGYFVCNGTAYRLARYFNPLSVPFGFVHLPTMDCGISPEQTAKALDRMIRRAAEELFPPSQNLLACSEQDKTLDSWLRWGREIMFSACEARVQQDLQRMLQVFSPSKKGGDVDSAIP